MKMYSDKELNQIAEDNPELRFLVQRLKLAQDNVRLSRHAVISSLITCICILLIIVLLILNIIIF